MKKLTFCVHLNFVRFVEKFSKRTLQVIQVYSCFIKILGALKHLNRLFFVFGTLNFIRKTKTSIV